MELEPARTAHNWQRGIALATCGDFERAAEQFRVHHQVNPDDVENSAWYFLCVAKSTASPPPGLRSFPVAATFGNR